MRPKPAVEVLDWFEQQQGASFFVSAITRAEILLGIALLPAGKRRDNLAAAAEQMFNEDFAGHSLAFDATALPNTHCSPPSAPVTAKPYPPKTGRSPPSP